MSLSLGLEPLVALCGLLALVLPAGLALAMHLEPAASAEADPRSRDPVAFLAVVLCSGAAVAIVAFWLLRILPLGLRGLAAALILGSTMLLLLRRRAARERLACLALGEHRTPLLLLAVVALIRFVPLALVAVAPGADMSMHSYMSRLILEADGVPASYAPLLPIQEFGAYAAGLPALGALAARLTGSSAASGAFAAACLSHLLVSLALYGYLRERCSASSALVAMLVATLGTRDPQHHFDWGGNPTVLALALTLLGLQLLDRLESERWARILLVVPLTLAAAAMTHAVIPYALAFILPVVFAARLWGSPAAAWRRVIGRGLWVAAVAALLMAPYLTELSLAVSPAEREWIRNWQRLPIHVPPGPAWLLPLGLIAHVAVRLGVVYTIWVAAALVIRRWLPESPAIREELAFSGVVLLLVLNAFVWWLPGSYAIYPDRITLCLIPPTARLIAYALDAARARSVAWPPGRRRGLLAVATGGTAITGLVIWWFLALPSVSVTADDLAVIRHLGERTPPGAVIENNYGDAGIWIPALAFRPVRTPHINVVYLDEVEPWRRASRPRYLFLGARQVYQADSPHSAATLAARPDRYRLLHRAGSAGLYAIVDPSSAGP